MVCLSTLYHFKFFKGCLPQILFGPFLNTLTHLCEFNKAGAYEGKESLIFMKCNFKINLDYKLLLIVMGGSIILREIYVEVEWCLWCEFLLHSFHTTHISWLGKHGNQVIWFLTKEIKIIFCACQNTCKFFSCS